MTAEARTGSDTPTRSSTAGARPPVGQGDLKRLFDNSCTVREDAGPLSDRDRAVQQIRTAIEEVCDQLAVAVPDERSRAQIAHTVRAIGVAVTGTVLAVPDVPAPTDPARYLDEWLAALPRPGRTNTGARSQAMRRLRRRIEEVREQWEAVRGKLPPGTEAAVRARRAWRDPKAGGTPPPPAGVLGALPAIHQTIRQALGHLEAAFDHAPAVDVPPPSALRTDQDLLEALRDLLGARHRRQADSAWGAIARVMDLLPARGVAVLAYDHAAPPEKQPAFDVDSRTSAPPVRYELVSPALVPTGPDGPHSPLARGRVIRLPADDPARSPAEVPDPPGEPEASTARDGAHPHEEGLR